MPASEEYMARRAAGDWSEFDVQLAISLICRKVHLEKPPKHRGEPNIHFAKKFNAALNPSEANFHEEDLDESDICDLLEWLLMEKKGAIARLERLGVRRISRASLLAFLPSRNFTGTLVEWNHGGRRDAVMKRPRGDRRRKFLPRPGEKIKMHEADGTESDGELSDGEIVELNTFYPEPAEKSNSGLAKKVDRNKSNVTASNGSSNYSCTATAVGTSLELHAQDTAGYLLKAHSDIHPSREKPPNHSPEAPYVHVAHQVGINGVVQQGREGQEAGTIAIEQPQPQVAAVCPTPAHYINNHAMQSAASIPRDLSPALYDSEVWQTGSQQAVSNNVPDGGNGFDEVNGAFTMVNHDAFLHNSLTGASLDTTAYTATLPLSDHVDTKYYAAASSSGSDTTPAADIETAMRPYPQTDQDVAATLLASGLDGSADSIRLHNEDLPMPAADDVFHASFDDLVAWDGDA